MMVLFPIKLKVISCQVKGYFSECSHKTGIAFCSWLRHSQYTRVATCTSPKRSRAGLKPMQPMLLH